MIPLAIFDASSIFDYFFQHANYLFVFLFMTIESSFIPFPSEIIVPPAAYMACTGLGAGSAMNIFMVVVVATLGALAGAFINYYLALWIGRPIVYKFADSKFGHACLINRQKVEKAEAYFDSHGAISTLIGRLIPAIRQLISIPAGISRMNIGVFSLFTAIGALIWNAVLATLGWWLSTTIKPDDLLDKIEEYNQYLTWGGLALGVVCIAYILWNALKQHK
ncbi:MAG: DedA family protein [Clostridium sp.]|nr:DedA family protein [Prevotella sp.]MCM1429234.1 DedA family protein [Clostridium sp.]MCM1475733.1 DedA family protein [Muribaculaceae bacterium]